MNPEIAVYADAISKQYRIGGRRERYKTFRETLTDAVSAPFRRTKKLLRGQATGAAELDECIWAIKDVSFEIKRGEAVGIIGRNGAGKSTLLKVLSRIAVPTEGYGEIRGRVGSLLEVGTGFHLELTGRENIYLNGAILGMRRSEIESKFDEIVDFAEVEKFIDTPVKHYSSGMYLRLAFAVAAHLEPDILIVDEVLAVGDARFQKKCLNKMQDVGSHGRTVIFVSHSMPAIARLCERAILLDEGRIVKDGPSHVVASAYMNNGFGTAAIREWTDPMKSPGRDVVRLRAVRAISEDGEVKDAVDIREQVRIQMEYDVIKSGYVLSPKFHFYNEEGVYLFMSVDLDPHWRNRPRPTGRYISTAQIPGNLLSEGTLFVGAGMSTVNPVIAQFRENDVVSLHVVDGNDGDSARGDWAGKYPGVLRPILKWNTVFSEKNANTRGAGS